MNHKPISLGFAALAAMSLTVACNVDPNRVDPNVDDTILKKECAAANAVNLNVINANRIARLEDSKAVNILAEKGDLAIVEESTNSDKNRDENAIELDISTCQVDKTATIMLPASLEADDEKREIVATVKEVDTHKLVLENEEASFVLEVTGAEAKMSEIATDNMAEDGVNQVKLTKTAKDGTVKIYISDSLESGSELVGLDEATVALIQDTENQSLTLKSLREKLKTQSGGSLTELKGTQRLTIDNWRAVRDETTGLAAMPVETLDVEDN